MNAALLKKLLSVSCGGLGPYPSGWGAQGALTSVVRLTLCFSGLDRSATIAAAAASAAAVLL